MMLNAIDIRDNNHIRVRFIYPASVPALVAPSDMIAATCSSVLTKMTANMYQKEVDIAKHEQVTQRVSAAQMLMKLTERCFALVQTHSGTAVSRLSKTDAIRDALADTNEKYIASAQTFRAILQHATVVVSIVEEVE